MLVNDTTIKEGSPAVSRRKCFLINTAYFALILAIVFLIIRYALSALMPFVIAAIVAAILRRPVRFLHRKLRFPYKLTGIVLTVIVYICIALAAILTIDAVVDLGISFLQSVPGLWSRSLAPALREISENVVAKIEQFNINLDLDLAVENALSTIGSGISSVTASLLGYIGNLVYSLPTMLINVIICIVSTLFILFDWDVIRDFIFCQLSKNHGDMTRKITQQSSRTLKQFVLSYGLILLMTFVELSIGLSIIGIGNSILIAAGIAVFDILPIVGCGAVLIPWMLVSFILGNIPHGVGLTILYIIITVVRNSAEPKIVGNQVGLHPLVTLMSMVIGSSIMGGVGLLGFPIALAVINKMNKEGVIHLYKRMDGAQ